MDSSDDMYGASCGNNFLLVVVYKLGVHFVLGLGLGQSLCRFFFFFFRLTTVEEAKRILL